ncbi:RDD family protein [Cellulomonas sp.]|uniref:RDD family protein n=1 Tax=Cellulomonas sp. TaxID=40001 RepID=UPI002D22804C|nr:RDD family protein [Cellulomonas sp.]HYQ77299.1 RDD family protein [Cellulomonas sp.]
MDPPTSRSGPPSAPGWSLGADVDDAVAPVWRRLVALVVDQALAVLVGGAGLLAVLPALRSDGSFGALLVPGLLLLLLAAGQWFAEAFGGRTVGGALLGTRTVSARTGRAPGLWAVLVRSVVQALGVLLGGVGVYVVAGSGAWDEGPEQRGWHDKAAGTLVLRARAPRREDPAPAPIPAAAAPAPATRASGPTSGPPRPATTPSAGPPAEALPRIAPTSGPPAPVAPAPDAVPGEHARPAPDAAPGEHARPAPDTAPGEHARPAPDAAPREHDRPVPAAASRQYVAVPDATAAEPTPAAPTAAPDVPAPSVASAVPDPAPAAADPVLAVDPTPTPAPDDTARLPRHAASAAPAPAVPAAPAATSALSTDSLLGLPDATVPTADLGDVEHTRVGRWAGSLDAASSTLALVLDTGDRVAVTGPGLIGRRPAPGAEQWAHLVTIHDPEQSVSSTHLAFWPVDGGLDVVDRGSTNGTVLLDAAGKPWSLPPGQPARVGAGWTLVLGSRRITVAQA